VNGSRNGAILLSFGSNVKASELPRDKVNEILKVFSKLKQRVIMKWEADHLAGKPENVLVSNWLPQDDILAHPKIKLFISHCGYGGMIEAKYHAVPIICIPFAGDQFANSIKAVDEGWAIKISSKDLNEETLSAAINEILTNPKYAQTVQRLSLLIRDRPMSALDTAVYWTEYVMRHHGAPHLHYPGADLNFFQYNSIDVILFLIGVIYLILKVFKLICNLICCGKKSGKKLKTN
jgi:glucuronosyltransferase